MGVLLPPLAVGMDKGCGADFCINLVLTIFLVYIGGILHAFNVMGVECITNILCLFLPPLGAWKAGNCVNLCIGLLLTLLGFFPGVIYAYYVALDNRSK